jgi:hypothetical protein
MAAFEAYPNELLQLKWFLLRKQYHQCIKTSNELLASYRDSDSDDRHPLSGMFATFYLALAHDELARSMHEHSAFKITTFDRAEQHYRQTIKLLPGVDECRSMLKSDGEARQQQALMQEPGLRTDELSALVSAEPVCQSPAKQEESDPESHDGFEDLSDTDMPCASLPHRQLERDYSSISLLTVPPKLTRSVSQGLLRPIRPGSPPRSYHLPPKLPYYGQNHSSQPSRSPSPLPTAPEVAILVPTTDRIPVLEEPDLDLTRLSEHIDGMHKQIKTLVSLLHSAKLATTVAQAERASRVMSTRHTQQKCLPQSKSFWSFTPVNVKLAEKQKKVEEGRARGWERKRYRSERYEALMEDALSEL